MGLHDIRVTSNFSTSAFTTQAQRERERERERENKKREREREGGKEDESTDRLSASP